MTHFVLHMLHDKVCTSYLFRMIEREWVKKWLTCLVFPTLVGVWYEEAELVICWSQNCWSNIYVWAAENQSGPFWFLSFLSLVQKWIDNHGLVPMLTGRGQFTLARCTFPWFVIATRGPISPFTKASQKVRKTQKVLNLGASALASQ